MCVCNCASVDINEKFSVLTGIERPGIERPGIEPSGIRYKPKTGLFNWITILLITGWILVVAVATTNIQVDDTSDNQSVQTFIKGMI